MVFSSPVSSFLDPSNWSQQTNQQQQEASGNVSIRADEALSHHQLPPLPPNPNPRPQHHGGGSARFAAGGSMVEQARLAKIPQPEGALKCPRCDSNNTKFCYFNNYNLAQPRHFCKTCRRYWTRGGALRNVPVGGGCRRNKKGKAGNSKSLSSSSSSASQEKQTSGHHQLQQQPQTSSQFPFLPSLQNLAQLSGIGLNLSAINTNSQAQMALSNGTGTSLMNDLGFLHAGASTSGLNNSSSNNNQDVITPAGTTTQLALFDPATGLYSFHNEGDIRNYNIGLSSLSSSIAAARVSQMAPLKTEEANLVNLSRAVSGLTSSANSNNPILWPFSDFLGSSSNNHIL